MSNTTTTPGMRTRHASEFTSATADPTGSPTGSPTAGVAADCTCGGREVFAVATLEDAQLIRAGVIDDDAIKAFTQGQCGAFARALHDKTGWPIVAVIGPDEWSTNHDVAAHIDDNDFMDHDGLNKYADHLLVVHPDGSLIDITGRTSAADEYANRGYERPWPLGPFATPVDLSYSYPDDELDDMSETERAEAIAHELDILRDDADGRIVYVRPEDTEFLFNRRSAIEAARTLVDPLLASLDIVENT